MKLSTKILIIAGAILAFFMVGFMIVKQYEITMRQDAIEKQIVEQKQLADGIVRSMAQYATRDDIERYIKDNNVNLKAIKEDLDKLNAALVAVNISSANSKGQKGNDIPSTHTTPSTDPPSTVVTVECNGKQIPCPDKFGYQSNRQTLSLTEQFDHPVPFGTVGFSAWKEKPWDVDIAPRQYNSVTVIGKDENERLYTYNKFTINVQDKEHEIKITKSETKQVYPESKFSFWNPRLHLTVGGAMNLTMAPLQGSANAGAALGIMSYGRFKSTPDISVLQVGAGYQTGTNRPSIIVNPVNFNIQKLVPGDIIKNTYIGPSVQMDTGGNVFAGANLSVGL